MTNWNNESQLFFLLGVSLYFQLPGYLKQVPECEKRHFYYVLLCLTWSLKWDKSASLSKDWRISPQKWDRETYQFAVSCLPHSHQRCYSADKTEMLFSTMNSSRTQVTNNKLVKLRLKCTLLKELWRNSHIFSISTPFLICWYSCLFVLLRAIWQMSECMHMYF